MSSTSNAKIAVITPTRDRLFALSLLHKYLYRQTSLPDLWIIATDGTPPDPPQKIKTIVTTAQYAGSPLESFAGNLRRGLDVAEENDMDIVFFMEDDDWYAANYLEKMLRPFGDGAQIVGADFKRYFHVREGYEERTGTGVKASLARTGFTRAQFDLFRQIIKQELTKNSFTIDLSFYETADAQEIPIGILSDRSLHLGVKGMYNSSDSNSAGLTKRHHSIRHRKNRQLKRLLSPFLRRENKPSPEELYEKLCEIIGEEDAQSYRDIIAGEMPPPDFTE